MDLQFISRTELSDREWDNQAEKWERPDITPETLKELNRRSTAEGVMRLALHTICIVATGWLSIIALRYHILLAVIPFLLFAFFVGFLNGIEHEMRHKIVFSRRLDGFSDVIYFLLHVVFKTGSRYQRVSHRIHHRYTMVSGVDPESDFPLSITTAWVRKVLWGLAITVLTLGIPAFFKSMWILAQRITGRVNPKIRDKCGAADYRYIRRESFVIFFLNAAALAVLIWAQRWDLILLLILGPQIGSAIVAFYHLTEHIGMMYNANDQRLCTRGVKVSPVVKFFYGGLDEHVEHHLFPGVPSRNLSKLREAIGWPIPERRNVIQCWREIFTIARHKEAQAGDEFMPEF